MDLRVGLFVLVYIIRLKNCSAKYVNYSLENDKVCKLSYKVSELQVGLDDHSGLIVRQDSYFSSMSGKHSFNCTFTVRASFNRGLFAVIQKMSFRQIGGKCIDFVQFRESRPSKLTKVTGLTLGRESDEGWTRGLCGSLERLHQGQPASSSPEDTSWSLPPTAFWAKDGAVDVKIHVASLRPDPSDPPIDVEIAFTSYLECSRDMGAYKYCGNRTCIYKEYFDDGIINCPFYDCADESQCEPVSDGEGVDPRFGVNTKVTVTAVTSIFLSFFLFLGFIWVCRYFEMVCWGGRRAGSRPGVELGQIGESAPDESPPPPSATPTSKDLPPPYESLFPDR